MLLIAGCSANLLSPEVIIQKKIIIIMVTSIFYRKTRAVLGFGG
tara:strand:+ start:125 stop:256 length:132 start_codon:yes stop_codon:yes gene_type:complete